MLIVWIIVFSMIGSIGAILAAIAFINLGKIIQKSLVPILVAYATGTLLAAASLGMIPTAIANSSNGVESVMIIFLAAILFLFIMEKLVIWRHCHDIECEVTSLAAGPIILIGDAFHNLIDGVVIAAAFLTNFNIGIAVSLSVIAHEIPQEVGDFAVLIDKNYSKNKAFLFNTLSGSTTIPAAIIGYFVLDLISELIPYVLAISAASFIYIALSDLTPELHKIVEFKYSIRQLILILAGISTMLIIFAFK